jgi:hypothetical protein
MIEYSAGNDHLYRILMPLVFQRDDHSNAGASSNILHSLREPLISGLTETQAVVVGVTYD